MGILWYGEDPEGRAASHDEKNDLRKYTRVFRVKTDGKNISQKAVLAGVPIPLGWQYQTATETDSTAFLRSKSCRQDGDNPQLWKVTLEYSNEVDQSNLDPWERTPLWRVSFQQAKQAVAKDLDGRPLVNSAGDPFLPPVEVPGGKMQLVCEINKISVDYLALNELMDPPVTNDAVYASIPKWGLTVAGIEASEQEGISPTTGGSILWIKLTYTLSVDLRWGDPDDPAEEDVPEDPEERYGNLHPVRILDTGFYEWRAGLTDTVQFFNAMHNLTVPALQLINLAGIGGGPPPQGYVVSNTTNSNRSKVLIRDGHQSPKSTQSLLDGYGRALKPNAQGKIIPVYQNFRLYKEVNFSELIP